MTLQVLKMLLSTGIDLNAKTETGDTSLLISCTATTPPMDFISALLSAKADPSTIELLCSI